MAKLSAWIKRHSRRLIQWLSLFLHNPFVSRLFTKQLYTGAGKYVCVPGLNCYSCPAAVGACPIGSLQQGLYSMRVPYYVLGTLILIGVTLGRVVCGFLCPFGLLQDLLYKIPFFKKINRFRADRALRWLKYVLLAVTVIILPLFFVSEPVFCKYICPQGTLQGGLTLAHSASTTLNLSLGFLFKWKVAILGAILLLCLLIYRPFCKYLCPLGAIYGLFNPIAAVRLRVDEERCTKCGVCSGACKLCVEPYKKPNDPECIRCGDCIRSCPHRALSLGLGNIKKKKEENKDGEKENGVCA
ncbi:MAG: 4Fe-4S binding protein [Clostridia bacterium]|nr:4Fe-4S binding protein [Clostridia bacterium]